MQLWISSEEERYPGSGSDPRGGQPGQELCRRCGHSRLLRQHPEGHPDGVAEGADLGSKGTEVDSPMDGSWSDGGRNGEGDASGNPARRSDLAVAGQYLPEQIGSDLGG